MPAAASSAFSKGATTPSAWRSASASTWKVCSRQPDRSKIAFLPLLAERDTLFLRTPSLALQLKIECVRAALDFGRKLREVVIFLGQLLFGDRRLAIFARNLGADNDLVCTKQRTGHTVEIDQRIPAGAVRRCDRGAPIRGLEHHGRLGQGLTVEGDDPADAP